MMIEDRFFDQEFVQEMSNEDFRMLLYLLHFASKKTGIVELNMRMLNFSANTGKKYSIDEVLDRFGKMIRLIPNRKTTAIFPSYIFINWMKNGIPENVNTHPLYKSIAKELSSFGLTLEDVFEMNRKMKGNGDGDSDCSCDNECEVKRERSVKEVIDYGGLFSEFWNAYPSECPRKVDKKKCREKFVKILKGAKDAKGTFSKIMDGLSVWKVCDTWAKDGGRFIRAPLVWLNGECWNDAPSKCDNRRNENGNYNRKAVSANANVISEDTAGLF